MSPNGSESLLCRLPFSAQQVKAKLDVAFTQPLPVRHLAARGHKQLYYVENAL